ncbi:hypothetical protein JYT74_00315 [Crocinitomix catalasitica]|nr:hypothetical protein [Crocinitomix catalasitica]
MIKRIILIGLICCTSPFILFGQTPDPYYNISIGDARIDTQIFESEFIGQTQLRMVNRRNKDIKGFDFLGGELRVKDSDERGAVNKGGELSPEAIALLANSGGKLIEMTIKFKDLNGIERLSRSMFAVINDSEDSPME